MNFATLAELSARAAEAVKDRDRVKALTDMCGGAAPESLIDGTLTAVWQHKIHKAFCPCCHRSFCLPLALRRRMGVERIVIRHPRHVGGHTFTVEDFTDAIGGESCLEIGGLPPEYPRYVLPRVPGLLDWELYYPEPVAEPLPPSP